MSSMEVTNDMSLSMVDIRAQFSRMSTFMIEMAKRWIPFSRDATASHPKSLSPSTLDTTNKVRK